MAITQKRQIKALIELLGKESGQQAVFLRGELARIMKEAPHDLHEVIEQDFHSSVPAALVYNMEEVCWEDLTQEITAFAAKINPSLEEALSIVTRFVNPAVKTEEVTQDLDRLTHALHPFSAQVTHTQDLLQAMAHFFISVEKFIIVPTARDIKEVSFGRFLQKKLGSSLCLACLYVLCAERFGLEAGVVDLAGRLLVSMRLHEHSEVLFADPAKSGLLLTSADCRQYIDCRNLQWNEAFLTPLSSRTLLRRFLGNMIFILNKLKDERRLTYLRRYMDILKINF